MVIRTGAKRKFLLFLICTSILFLYSATFSSAQGQSIPEQISLVSKPKFPKPNSVAEISLNAYTLNTTGSTIRWYVNDTEQISSRNERTISVDIGDLGKKVQVEARISLMNGSAYSVVKTIIPINIDVIIEANTSVPVFYRGRSLPSQGAPIRVVAIPHTGDTNNTALLTYKWTLNDKVLLGGPVVGKQSIDITMPTFKNARLTVEVTDPNNKLIGEETTILSASEPELHFYEYNPLLGLSRKSVKSPLVLLGEEATIRAEPFFMGKTDNDTILYEWELNSQKVENKDSDSHMITLRPTGGGGAAHIHLRVANTIELFQNTENSFQLQFQ